MLGSIGTAVYRSQIAGALPFGIPATAAQAARDTLAGATVAAQHLPNQLAAALLTPAREAFTSELHVIATISAILLMGMALLVVIMLRHVRPSSEGQPEQPDGADAAQVTVQESRQS
jgi:DHA2 family multidrug resistance protein-like MFS transporter